MGGRWNLRLAIAAVACAAMGTGAPVVLAAGVGSWRAAGPMLSGHDGESAVTLANGRVLAVGESGEQTTAEIYDPGSRAWTRGPSLPERTDRWTVVALADGGALLIGADSCPREGPFRCSPTSTTHRLSPNDSTWLASTPMNVARGRPVAVRLGDGRVLVAGGFGDECSGAFAGGFSCAPLASAEIYDSTTNSWSLTTAMPSPRGGAAAALMSNGTVLLVGGAQHTRDALRYTPGSAEWTTLRGPAFAHTGAELIALPGDRAIALGEDTEADFYGSLGGAGARAISICESSPEIYTTANDTWTLAPSFPEGSIACSADGTLLTGGQVLYSAQEGLYVLDRRQLCWSAAAATAHEGLLAALPGGGALNLDVAGSSYEQPLGSETYTSGPSTCVANAHTQALIFSQLLPSGSRSTTASIAEHGYRLAFRAPAAGRVVIEWLLRPRTAIRAKPLPLAVGEGRWNRRGVRELKISLTGADAPAFAPGAVVVRVTAKATFTPVHGPPVTSARSFTLYPERPAS